jgi:DNA-directed RNA polymerase specialized sigma24 family protein
VFLKVFEGLTFQEIGAHCDVSLNTAASRYRYALASLRAVLDERPPEGGYRASRGSKS